MKTGSGRYARKRGSTGSAPASAWRISQQQPTPDRYQEIQNALSSKGYLKAPPSGAWDAASQDAMRRFQMDQKIEPSGRINSRSLIGLGLGPGKPSPSSAVSGVQQLSAPPTTTSPQ